MHSQIGTRLFHNTEILTKPIACLVATPTTPSIAQVHLRPLDAALVNQRVMPAAVWLAQKEHCGVAYRKLPRIVQICTPLVHDLLIG